MLKTFERAKIAKASTAALVALSLLGFGAASTASAAGSHNGVYLNGGGMHHGGGRGFGGGRGYGGRHAYSGGYGGGYGRGYRHHGIGVGAAVGLGVLGAAAAGVAASQYYNGSPGYGYRSGYDY